MTEDDPKDGEIITTGALDAGLAETIARAEIDTLISTARAYPRSLTQAQRRMLDLSTFDEEAAEESVYSLPRSGKTIEGPSIRFAEMAAQTWGNCRVAARTTVIDRKDKFVEAEGVFLDAETNVATLARTRRRIVDSRGRLYNDDMILMTCNAAQSIARRNAILAGIPKSIWRKPYEAARRVIMGDIRTLANRRAEAVKAFQRFGVVPDQIYAALGVKGEEDIDQEKLVPLRGMYSALVNGEETVETLFSSRAALSAKQFDKVENPLDDAPAKTQAAEPASDPVPEAGEKEMSSQDKPAEGDSGGESDRSPPPADPSPADEKKAEAKAEEKAEPAPQTEPEKAETEEIDPIKLAYGRGQVAARKGIARRAMPGEYRDEKRQDEADAWLEGYDAVLAEAADQS